MGLDIARLLEVRTWRAFDVDGEGRVLAGWDESGSVQLVEIGPDGANTPLTALPGPCSGRYLPGQRAIVVQHDAEGNERSQLSLLRPDGADLPAPPDALQPLVHDPEHKHDMVDVLPGRVVYRTNRRNGVDFDIVIRNVFTGEEETVYDRGGMVSAATVSADSRYVVLARPAIPPLSDQLVLVDTMPETENLRVRPLTGEGEHARNTHPHWLPDGRTLLVSSNRDRDFTGVARYDVHTGEWTWLVTSDEHDLLAWPSPDGRLLLVMADDDGASRLSLHDAGTGERLRDVELPTDGWVRYPQPEPVWSPDSRFVALSFSAPTVPGDVLRLDVATGLAAASAVPAATSAEQRTSPAPSAVSAGESASVVRCTPLTNSAEQLAGVPLSTPDTHRIEAPDGERIPCFRYPPTGCGAELDGSAVVLVHGGPEGHAVRYFNPVVQALTATGHTVLAPNVRGSIGYGKRWYAADDVYKRPDAVADLAALHDWLPSLGLDPRRAALWGGSYGGYMVLAGLAFQPERWAAGVSIVGISSLVTFLENTSPYRRAHREREYGSLAHDREFLHKISPLTRVDDVRAPLFLIHGANDPRVPLSEAQQVADALAENGIECELLVYSDEGHGLARRANRLDAFPKAIAFLGRHLARH
ncbi:S9 family peptidase [Gandjariella thermophila]|uniref:Peptidase S9 n=1 Tax=Gandjariella thermophila TaxID=1931992 RepID=A0A4D4J9R4_9PSEU|nr:S9 family peptidase [Gandjariella thermophila]GDY30677.1 peptidase S9 [Gandjariella thermophila]